MTRRGLERDRAAEDRRPTSAGRFAAGIVDFYQDLKPPSNLPENVDILWPYSNKEVGRVMDAFYRRYFSDDSPRIFLIGINPGRFGAGVTGICFTDPVRLARDCGIPHALDGGTELSSDFIYRMIEKMGGAEAFYRRFYITAMSPVGFLRDGKNLNYYDVQGLTEALEPWAAAALERQIASGADRRVAFSVGQGKNAVALGNLNDRYGFFDRIEPLPHPRWVMQYRRRRLDEFLDLYVARLSAAAGDGSPGS